MSRAFLCAAVAAACLLALPSSAAAESLGLNWFQAGATWSDDGQPAGRLAGDWRIGPAHGLQLDVGLAGRDGGAVGEIAAHLYLMPQADRKYGFFATLTDIDGREATSAVMGVEAMHTPTADWMLEARAGIGKATGGLDFIMAEARVSRTLTDSLSITGGLMAADFDEAALRAIGWRAEIGLAWMPEALPVEISAALVQDGLHGRNAAGGESRVELGLTWRFGAGGMRRPVAERAFSAARPLDPLIRRGLF